MRRLGLALLVSLLPAAVAAQDDKDRITRFLEENLSGAGRAVVIDGFRGALSSRATMDRMTIADSEGVWITLDGVVLDWNRLAVLQGDISINELSAEAITVARAPVADDGALPSPEAPGFALPDLPVSVNIGRIGATRVVLGEALLGQEVTGRLEASATLAGGEGRGSLVIDRLDGPTGRIALDASFANASSQLVLSLDMVEAAGGLAATALDLPGLPATEFSVQGAGPLSAFAARMRLATDGVERLAGTLTLRSEGDGSTGFAADLGGDIAPLLVPEHAAFFGPDVRLTANGSREAIGRLALSDFALVARSLRLGGSVVVGPDGLPEKVDVSGRIADPAGGPVLLPISASDPTRVQSADITLAYDAAAGEGWTASALAAAVERRDMTIAGLVLRGSGRITRAAGGTALPVVGGNFAFAAEGLAPVNPALAQALGPRISGALTAFWQRGSGVVNIGRLALTGADFDAQVSGTVDGLDSGLALAGRVSGQAADLSRFAGLAGRPVAGSGSFAFEGGGSPLGGAFDVQGTVTGTDLGLGIAEVDSLLRGAATVDVSAVRGEQGIVLRNLTLATATGARLAAQGTVATAGSVLTADLSLPDLSVLGDAYGGALTGQAGFTGTPAAGRVTLTGRSDSLRVGVAEVDGLLRGTGKLDLDVAFDGDRVQVAKGEVVTAQVQADVRGTWAPGGSDLTATFALPDAGVLGARYAGSLRGNAAFSGTAQDARVVLAGTGRDLAVGLPEVDGLLRGETLLDVDAAVQGTRVTLGRANLGNRQITAAVTGTWAPDGSDLVARLTLPSLAVLGPGYGGSLQAEARLEGTPAAGRIALDGTGRNITVSQPEADRLLRGDSTVRLRAGLEDGRLQIDEAKLRTPQIDAGASGTVTGESRRLQVEARLVNLGVLLPEFPGPLTVAGTVADDGRGYDLNLTAKGPGGIDARTAGRIGSGFAQADLTIGGTAQAGLANAFLGDRAIDGQVGFDLRLNGPLALRSLSGPVRLSGGRLADPALPFSLTGLAGTATLGGGSVNLSVGADVTSGGRIEVSGTAGLAAPYAGNLAVQLAAIGLRDPQLYETTLDGTVTVSGPLTGGAVIGGTILLDETEVRVPSTGLGGTVGLPDLRHVNEPAPVRQTRARAGLLGEAGTSAGGSSAGGGGDYALDLSVRARNRIFVRGRGLDAELGGGVELNGTLANIVASGGFELIRGRLDILGKRLTLDRANLSFQGDLMPLLDVQASSQSDGVTASVLINGRADAPVVTFASTPELPEDEVLAHLLFGQGLDNLSTFQALQLASAVATLAGRGGDGLVGKLRKGFGLDDLDVTSGSDGESTVRAGKYLAEGIYSQVEVESGGKSKVTLNLDLRRGLTARGSVGSDGDASLGLFLERDY